jgi:hypothetical protein
MIVAIAAVVAILVVLGGHFLSSQALVRAVKTESAHFKCSFCGLIVARFEQLIDSKIRCENCKRAAER